MQLARCAVVSLQCLLRRRGTTYSGDWADGWLKRNGPDMLALGLQGAQEPKSPLNRFVGPVPYYCWMLQCMQLAVRRLIYGPLGTWNARVAHEERGDEQACVRRRWSSKSGFKVGLCRCRANSAAAKYVSTPAARQAQTGIGQGHRNVGVVEAERGGPARPDSSSRGYRVHCPAPVAAQFTSSAVPRRGWASAT